MEKKTKLTFMESTGIIIGHGVGSGVLTVPWIVSHNNWVDFIWIGLLAFALNLLLHLMVGELSYNKNGAQFVTCFKETILRGKAKKPLTIIVFFFLALSVLLNCVSYIVGSASSIFSLFNGVIPDIWCRVIFFVLSMLVVFFGMKLVGICEKYCAYMMVIVLTILSVFLLGQDFEPLPTVREGAKAMMALYGVISFSLSSVMSVPTVVKGVEGDKKKIFWAVTLGLTFDIIIVFLLAFLTLLSVGGEISADGALIDISKKFAEGAPFIKYVCLAFNLLALATSFWANTLNLRDNIHETTKLNNKLSWLVAAVPTLIIALICKDGKFGVFTTIASAVQVLTGIGIIVAYGMSRKEKGKSDILGKFGSLVFQIIVVVFSLIATVGSLLASSLGK